MILVESSVVIDLLGGSEWFHWSRAKLISAGERGPLYINPIVYGEIASGYESLERLDRALAKLKLVRLGLPFEAAFEAARALKVYRSRGGARATMLPDFLIGAHANVSGLTLLTRDPRRVRSYFPDVALIAPE